MSGDPRIGRWLDVLRQEANPDNPAQAQSWNDMEAVLIALADGLKRHSSKLAQAWPSDAGRAYLAHIDAIIAPLDGGAIEAAGRNASAMTAIDQHARAAVADMQG